MLQHQGEETSAVSRPDTVLFHRLNVIMQRSPDIKPYFSYELSPQPTSLFKDNFIGKTDKSLLAKEIRKGVPDASFPATLSVPIIDGGYLLHGHLELFMLILPSSMSCM